MERQGVPRGSANPPRMVVVFLKTYWEGEVRNWGLSPGTHVQAGEQLGSDMRPI